MLVPSLGRRPVYCHPRAIAPEASLHVVGIYISTHSAVGDDMPVEQDNAALVDLRFSSLLLFLRRHVASSGDTP